MERSVRRLPNVLQHSTSSFGLHCQHCRFLLLHHGCFNAFVALFIVLRVKFAEFTVCDDAQPCFLGAGLPGLPLLHQSASMLQSWFYGRMVGQPHGRDTLELGGTVKLERDLC